MIPMNMNKDEPSWRELGKLIRKMTWAERREFLWLAFMPWPDRRDNIKMMVISLMVTLMYSATALAVLRAVTETYSTLAATALSAAVTFTFVTVILQNITRQLLKGVRARNEAANKLLMAEMQKVVDAMGAEILNKLKAASGRTHIDNNPVSMAAAQLDIVEKHRKPKARVNPLQAALEDSLHPSDLLGDDDESISE